MMENLRIGYVKETFRRQNLSAKVMVFRQLRRRNFGRMDHKRKAWWTIDLLRSENHEINWNKYNADCEEVESKEWRKAFKILVDNYIAENADSQFDYENKNSSTVRVILTLSRLAFRIRNDKLQIVIAKPAKQNCI